jgi:hypothetical protein
VFDASYAHRIAQSGKPLGHFLSHTDSLAFLLALDKNEECCSIYDHYWHLLVDLMDDLQVLPAFITDMNDFSDIFHRSSHS